MLTKNQYLFTTIPCALTLITCCTSNQPAGDEHNRGDAKPNIIFILADDLGYGDLGSYGQEKLSTPNLDKLADKGMRFTNFYAGNAVCCPSRSCLLTGLHPGHARHRGNYGIVNGVEGARVPFDPGTITIASVMKEAGYKTAHIGKWHLGGQHDNKTSAIHLGFDYSFGYFPNYLWTGVIKHKFRNSDYPRIPHYLDTMWRNNEKLVIEENVDQKMGKYQDDLHTEDALKSITANKDTSFFMYLAYQAPHAPMNPPTEEPFADKDWPEVERKFAATVYRLDDYVGQVVKTLKEAGIYKNTIIIFSSDNGPHNQAGHDHEFFNSNAQLRGHKGDLYEGGLREPFIVTWPGVVKPGTVSEVNLAFWDVLPTIADISGSTVPEGIDGKSFYKVLVNNDTSQVHKYLYWEFLEHQFDRAVRMGEWKAVRLDNDEIELYNLSSDEGEQNNVADQHPDIVAQMETIMDTARVDSPFWETDD